MTCTHLIAAYVPYAQGERQTNEVFSRMSDPVVVITLFVFVVIIALFFRRRR